MAQESESCGIFYCSRFYRILPDVERPPMEIKYTGFEIDPEFVIGFGLDYGELYRNLPFVGVVDEADLE